ncbi:ankyrin [Aulographum hederae CBS 113979]|uniref:Ankyrin n=1 Tax=Aulographum hederae CBS 113979 TaxID=1176131 RepID=A0A6G1GVX0_9PEZI|nr:ankyrin [Aulographum hederae CBS 113979]
MLLHSSPRLPVELIRPIVEYLVIVGSISHTLQARHVSRLFDREIIRALFVTYDFRYRPNCYRNTRKIGIYYEPLAGNFLVDEFKTNRFETSFLGQFRATVDWIADNCETAHPRQSYATALCQTAVACHDPLAAVAKLGGNVQAEFTPKDLPSAALVAAAASNDLVLASILIYKGARSDYSFFFLGTPLTVAACRGYEEMVHLLLKHRTEDVLDSLTAACSHGHSAIVETLIPNLGSNYRPWHAEQLFRAATRGGHEECLRLLSECAQLTDLLESRLPGRRFSLLRDAAECGHNHLVRLALEQGDDINDVVHTDIWEFFNPLPSYSEEPLFPLVGATLMDHTHTVELLLERGAHLANRGQGLPLAHAVGSGNQEITQILLDKRTPVNVNNSIAMMEAVIERQIFMMRFLASRGGVATYDILLYAIWDGVVPVIRVLIEELGVDPNKPSEGTPHAIPAAKEYGRADVIQLLKELGADDPEPEIPMSTMRDPEWVCSRCIKNPDTGGTVQLWSWQNRDNDMKVKGPHWSLGLHNIIP